MVVFLCSLCNFIISVILTFHINHLHMFMNACNTSEDRIVDTMEESVVMAAIDKSEPSIIDRGV